MRPDRRWATALFLLSNLWLVPSSRGEELRWLIKADDLAKVREQLDAGVDVNERYENDYTPIYFVRSPAMVELLVARGAKFDFRNKLGQTPLESLAEAYVRAKEDKERARAKALVDALRARGAEYTLNTAIYLDDVPTVRSRLQEGIKWARLGDDSPPDPLRLAAGYGRFEICKLLLEAGADPNAFHEGVGWPVAMHAVKHANIVQLLVEHGANLKRRITWRGARTGYWPVGDEATLLHYAAHDGRVETVKYLLSLGLDASAADAEGQTPLHVALRGIPAQPTDSDKVRYRTIIEALLENDASVTFPRRDGKNPIDLAQELDAPGEIVRLLEKKEKDFASN